MADRTSSRLTAGQKTGLVAAALIPLLVLGFFLAKWLIPHQGPDPLAGVKLAQPGVIVSPTSLLDSDDIAALSNMTNDGSLFGLPMSVRVVRVTDPLTQAATQDAAQSSWDRAPVETTKGAQNGLLLFVAVPANDSTKSTAAFVPGASFFPKGGLTQDRLDRTLTEIMQPLLVKGDYANAAKQGAAWVVYDQIFLAPPRVPLTDGQRLLNHLANWFLAPLLAVLGIGLVILARWTRRVARRNGGVAASPVQSPYVAAAIVRGCSDDALTTAAVLELFERGHLRQSADKRRIETVSAPDAGDDFATAIWQRIHSLGPEGVRTSAALRLADLLSPELTAFNTQLMRDGQFSTAIPPLNRRLWGACAATLLVILFSLAPILIGRAAAGFLVSVAVIIVIAAIVWWSFHRFRSTNAGLAESRNWLATQEARASTGDLEALAAVRIYRLIVFQEEFIGDRTAISQQFGPQALKLMGTIRSMSTA